eukprot:1274742-Ditylum_brightwellii.AAC.1
MDNDKNESNTVASDDETVALDASDKENNNVVDIDVFGMIIRNQVIHVIKTMKITTTKIKKMKLKNSKLATKTLGMLGLTIVINLSKKETY